jgi:hypothetical protein
LRRKRVLERMIEPLESRQLLTAITGGDAGNAWYVRRNPDNSAYVQVYNGDAPIGQPSYNVPDSLTINGGAGPDARDERVAWNSVNMSSRKSFSLLIGASAVE